MKVKLYIGEAETVNQLTKKKKITFVSAPTTSDTISWNYWNHYPIMDTQANNSVPLLAIPSPYTNEQMATDFASFISGTTSGVTATVDGASVTIEMDNQSPILNLTISGSYATFVDVYEDVVVENFYPIELHGDENISFTSKLSDIEKLSNIFTDFTNSFTVPASDVNNRLFKHYYDVDVDNTFNANIRVLAYLEIDTFPLRYGKLQLENVTVKSNRPENYKITFYGGLLQLSDLFGDDTINRLDYAKNFDTGEEYDPVNPAYNSLSQFDYEFNSANYLSSLTDQSFENGQIITPLIAYANRDWNYGDGTSLDIGTDGGAIPETEVKPALRIYNILTGIETKYKIKFSRNFFDKAVFQNLFLWLNEKTTDILGVETEMPITLPLTGYSYDHGYGTMAVVGNYIDVYSRRWTNYGAVHFRTSIDWTVTPSDNSVSYTAIVRDEFGTDLQVTSGLYGPQTININWEADFNMYGDEFELIHNKVKLLIIPSQTLSVTVQVHLQQNRQAASMMDYATDAYSTISPSINLFVRMIVKDNIPPMKVMDFFQGIMKMFKLIIRPLGGNIFYVNTLDGYYGEGNLLNITDYVNKETVLIERPVIYRNIYYKYQKTNNYPGVYFRESVNDIANKEIGYGDLKSIQPYVETKEELKIELPFENMLFERLPISYPYVGYGSNTNILIGQSISSNDSGLTFRANKSKPILFYNNGIANISTTPIKVSFKGTISTLNNCHLIGTSNDALITQVTNSLNFKAELDGWHLQEIDNTLYLNYWSNWIDTIYSLKQRKFTFESNLPPRYIEELSLNDRLIINDQRYKINDYTINLTTGDTKFTLFKDIYDMVSLPSEKFTPGAFTVASGLYLTDFTKQNSNGSYWLYGSFATYTGATANRVIKMNADGTQDHTFKTNLGGPNQPPYGFMTLANTIDDKLIVGGYFTQYNGVSKKYITRLNADGTNDSTFTIGTGFNNFVEKVLIEDTGNILVCGLFTSFNGNTANSIVRLNSNGTFNTTFGTGFNNTVNDLVKTSDGAIYASGYHSTFNGATSKYVTRILPGGTADSAFSTGATSFAPTYSGIGAGTIGMLPAADNGVYCYGGYFTSYNGVSANKIVKLDRTGAIDPAFHYGTGFNGGVNFLEFTSSGKLFASGDFTTYNGTSTSKAIILNLDGTINQTFDQTGYTNHYIMGNDVYAIDDTTGVLTKLTSSAALGLNTENIMFNAGSRYFPLDIFTNATWTLQLIDTGDGITWLTPATTSGTSSTEIPLKVSYNSLTTSRKMQIKVSNGVYNKWITVIQNGLM
jgi:hypothetical protein